MLQSAKSSARKKVNLLVEKCLDLADMPYMGRARPDLGKNLPLLVFQNYLTHLYPRA
jgi:plasmid stabilization system protein ParE